MHALQPEPGRGSRGPPSEHERVGELVQRGGRSQADRGRDRGHGRRGQQADELSVEHGAQPAARRNRVLEAQRALQSGGGHVGRHRAADRDVWAGHVEAAALGPGAELGRVERPAQRRAHRGGALFQLLARRIELRAAVGRGHDHHRAIRPAQERGHPLEDLLGGYAETGGDVAAMRERHLDADPPRQQHVLDRDALQCAGLADLREPAQVLVADRVAMQARRPQDPLELVGEALGQQVGRHRAIGRKLGPDLVGDPRDEGVLVGEDRLEEVVPQRLRGHA